MPKRSSTVAPLVESSIQSNCPHFNGQEVQPLFYFVSVTSSQRVVFIEQHLGDWLRNRLLSTRSFRILLLWHLKTLRCLRYHSILAPNAEIWVVLSQTMNNLEPIERLMEGQQQKPGSSTVVITGGTVVQAGSPEGRLIEELNGAGN